MTSSTSGRDSVDRRKLPIPQRSEGEVARQESIGSLKFSTDTNFGDSASPSPKAEPEPQEVEPPAIEVQTKPEVHVPRVADRIKDKLKRNRPKGGMNFALELLRKTRRLKERVMQANYSPEV